MPQRWPSFDQTITILFFLVIAATACLMPVQNDTWWHLRAGREMWSQHAVMLRDEFSFTARGHYWPNHEWLSQVVFYAVYQVAGLPGITAVAAACVTAAVAWSWRLMRGPALTRLLLVALATSSLAPVWTVRPHVFSLLLLMVVLGLVLRERYRPLPIVFVLWANLHGGVALGFVVLAAAALADTWKPLSRGTVGSPRVRRWAVLLPACLAATLLTPLGIHLWTTIPESVQKSMANGIMEWRPAVFAWRDAAFWLLAISLVAALVVKRRTIETRDEAVLAIASVLLLPLAIRYSRNISPFLLLALPALSRRLTPLLADKRSGVRREHDAANRVLVAAATLAAVLVVGISWSRPAFRLGWQPVSPGVVEAVDSCPGPIYNRFDDGGYLIWFAPDVPVFVDNRQDPYPLAFLQQHLHTEQTGRFEPVFAQYGIGCAFLPPASPTARRLVAAGWDIRAADGRWLVLQKPGGSR